MVVGVDDAVGAAKGAMVLKSFTDNMTDGGTYPKYGIGVWRPPPLLIFLSAFHCVTMASFDSGPNKREKM